MARFNRINAGPYTEGTPQAMEAIASVALTPGALAVVDASGEFAYADAATTGQCLVMQENTLLMRGVETDWDAGDTAIAHVMLPEKISRLLVVDGSDLAIGTPLTPAASGRVAVAGASDMVVAFSAEKYNNTTGSDQLVEVRASTGYLTASA